MTVSVRVKNEGSSVSISARITVQERVCRESDQTELWKDVGTLYLASMEDAAQYLTKDRRLVLEEVEMPDIQRVVLTDEVLASG